MFKRTIIIAGQPHVQIELTFDSKSNAYKSVFSAETKEFVIEDDYGQQVTIGSNAEILADIVIDISESLRAQGEVEIVKARAEMKFNDRVEKDAPIRAFRIKKQTEAAMRNAPRVAMPNGMPQ